MLFPFQRVLVQWALRKGRAAIFADTGLGKSFCQITWAQLTGQRILILAPLSVARQTVNEAKKIGVEVHYTRSGSDLIPGINITNYEMMSHFNPADFGAVVLDESSCLKGLTSVTRAKLIEMFADTPYRLCCTATPAPNDITEIANHAEFLGIMTRADMLATFFVHDSETSAHAGWRLKGHAEEAFYRWMASWSMSIKKPSDLHFDDTGYVLPPLNVTPVIVDTNYVPDGSLFYMGIKGIQDQSHARKGTTKERVERAVQLTQSNSEQWVLWCGLNAEQDALASALKGECVSIPGNLSPDEKERRIELWTSGQVRLMVSKPSVLGFGMNFQNCHNMAFVGLNYSWESYYQAVRRCLRYGQAFPVNVYIILSEIEQEIYANVMRKEQEANKMSEQLIQHVQSFEQDEINRAQKREEYTTATIQNEHYTLMLGDSCERMAEIASESVDLSIFSPPFMDLYTYSPTERDLGNNRTPGDFYQHFTYIIDHLLRVTKPGRNCCVHVQQIAAKLVSDGFIGLKDFRGEVIQAFISRGWVYHGDVTIDRNPQIQAIRSHAKGLLFAQLHKDASWMRPGLADYILIFHKPGENTVPIHPDLTNEEWITWAHPVWYHIKETETLNTLAARDERDEKHACPLQLGTIERCIRLWSNKGETICSPFAGIGSEGYMALKLDRKFVGVELKPSYFREARKYLDQMLRSKTQATLFDGLLEEGVAV
jgi:DNA modification methylase